MDLKEAKEIFEEISELCGKIDDHNLTEALEAAYSSVQEAEDVYQVLEVITDLMFYVDDISWDDEDIEEAKSEIQELLNKLQDNID